MGPCMCGDTHCGSCGPLQGNWRCPICNAWADDCCTHISEETGDLKPEFEEEAHRIAQDQYAAEEAYAQELKETYAQELADIDKLFEN